MIYTRGNIFQFAPKLVKYPFFSFPEHLRDIRERGPGVSQHARQEVLRPAQGWKPIIDRWKSRWWIRILWSDPDPYFKKRLDLV